MGGRLDQQGLVGAQPVAQDVHPDRPGRRLRPGGSGRARGILGPAGPVAPPRPEPAGPEVVKQRSLPAPAHVEGPPGPGVDQQVDVPPQLGRHPGRERRLRFTGSRGSPRGGCRASTSGSEDRSAASVDPGGRTDGGLGHRYRGDGCRRALAGRSGPGCWPRRSEAPSATAESIGGGRPETAVAVSIDAAAHSCDEFDQRAECPLGVDEGHRGPPRPGPGRLVDDPAPVVLDRLEGDGAVGHPVADVVEPLTLLLQVLGHRGVLPDGGEQLDVAVRHLQERLFDPVGLDPLAVVDRGPEGLGVVGDGRLEVVDGDGHMVDLGEQGLGHRPPSSSSVPPEQGDPVLAHLGPELGVVDAQPLLGRPGTAPRSCPRGGSGAPGRRRRPPPPAGGRPTGAAGSFPRTPAGWRPRPPGSWRSGSP